MPAPKASSLDDVYQYCGFVLKSDLWRITMLSGAVQTATVLYKEHHIVRKRLRGKLMDE